MRASKTLIKDILENKKSGEDVVLMGWVRTFRKSKSVDFAEIYDGSTTATLQVVFDKKFIDANKLSTGSSIVVRGRTVSSEHAKQDIEVLAGSLEIIGLSDDEYPIQKKRHTREFLREIAHLRPRARLFQNIFSLRSKTSLIIHDFFRDNGFTYIHTPIMTKTDCEGGGETFAVGKDFYDEDCYLSVSGQLEVEPFVSSHGDVYTFGPCFRADPSDTPRHASEFWMIEPEMAFCDKEDLIDFIEFFIKSVVGEVIKQCSSELEFFDSYVQPGKIQQLQELVGEKFSRISFKEAVSILAEKKFENKASLSQDLFTEHEKYLTDIHHKAPVFVTDYPKAFKAFYMRENSDGETVGCVDLLMPGLGELITGSQREERFSVLKEKMEENGLDTDYKWYLETRKWGTVPHSGFGLGLDRLIMYLSGVSNIKDVLPFPRASRRIY